MFQSYLGWFNATYPRRMNPYLMEEFTCIRLGLEVMDIKQKVNAIREIQSALGIKRLKAQRRNHERFQGRSIQTTSNQLLGIPPLNITECSIRF